MYTVTHSKLRLLRQSGRFLGNAWRFVMRYDRPVADWQDGYGRLTSEGYWRDKLLVSEDGKRP